MGSADRNWIVAFTLLALYAVVPGTATSPAKADIVAAGYDEGGIVLHYGSNGVLVGQMRNIWEGTCGITVGPSGDIYVTTFAMGHGAVSHYATANGPLIGSWGNSDYTDPYGIALAPNGVVYVASAPAYISSTESFGVLGIFGTASGDLQLLPTNYGSQPSITDLAFGPDGGLYYGGAGFGVRRMDLDSLMPRTFVPTDSALGTVSGLEFGPDGNLYAGSASGVRRYNGSTGAFMDVFVANGSGGLQGVTDLTFGDDGFLYINSRNANAILRYSATTGQFVDTFTTYSYPSSYDGPGQIDYLAVPEPSALCLAAVGGALLLRRRCRK